MIAQLTSLFGALALLLAAMALGANRLDVQRLVLRGAFVHVGAGRLIGIPAALVAGHLMAAQLCGVMAYNPLVIGVTMALVAAALPTRRTASVEPTEALRVE
jgi:hypothetical protein